MPIVRDVPQKPPRPSIAFAQGTDLQKEQDLCSKHRQPLDSYCSKCRLVICDICRISDHIDPAHKILTTPDALSLLRTEAVTLLRHYTLLQSMFSAMKNLHSRYECCNPNMRQVTGEIYSNLRLHEEQYLVSVVDEAETIVGKGKNLKDIRERIIKWEKHQHNWGHIVFLYIRCRLLTNINAANDMIYIRVKEWQLPTPWIHLSHLLQPYLGDNALNLTPNSDRHGPHSLKVENERCSTTASTNKNGSSEVIAMRGQEGKSFPHNSRSVLLQGLLPYIILNPQIRYFMRISNNINTDMTLVVEPSEEHVLQYLSRQRYTATYSPGTLRKSGYAPSDDSLTIVEKQMMMGGKQRSKLVASYGTSKVAGNSSTIPFLVKVSFPDILVVAAGLGLAAAHGSVQKGDIIVDSDPNRGLSLSIVLTSMGVVPALRIGHVIQGLESFKCLVENEEKRRADATGLRAKIKASVRKEEDASFEITFGIDI